MTDSERELIEEQIAYYRARAAEYDATSPSPEGDPFVDGATATRDALRAFAPRGRVIELAAGTGQWTVNGRALESYFPNKLHQQVVNEPFVTTDLVGRFDVIARIHGGGITGQAGALRLGVARALNAVDVDANRPSLKKAGLLTRDARVIERKKAGLKKARKAPQYSKR